MKTIKNEIEDLKEISNKLLELLNNPEPDLLMWCSMVGLTLDKLAEHAPSYKKFIK